MPAQFTSLGMKPRFFQYGMCRAEMGNHARFDFCSDDILPVIHQSCPWCINIVFVFVETTVPNPGAGRHTGVWCECGPNSDLHKCLLCNVCWCRSKGSAASRMPFPQLPPAVHWRGTYYASPSRTCFSELRCESYCMRWTHGMHAYHMRIVNV